MFQHVSVLLNESVDMLNVKSSGIYVDATLGGGGHSSEILKRLGKDGLLFSFDKDSSAIKASSSLLKKISPNFEIIYSDFANMKNELQNRNIEKVDGILFDIGVSSHQFDTADRGFSYNYDGRLDMRMDKNQSLDAYYIINNYSKEKLTEIFYTYGEEPFSKQIAAKIVEIRKKRPIETTFQLVDVIKSALPNYRKNQKGHPAKQIFQAIRIEVNNELDGLKNALYQALDLLNKDGRVVVITFHSLEDRIVKNIFNEKTKQQNTVKGLVDMNQKKIEYQLINKKPITASEEELKNNNRAHSAKLRGIQKI